MIKEADIKNVIDLVMRDVELFKVDKGLDPLYLLELTTSKVEVADEFERSAKVTKALDDRITHP